MTGANTATEAGDVAGPNDGIAAPAARRQRTERGSPVRWVINDRYGIGRDDAQYIVYRAVTPKTERCEPHKYRAVAYHLDLESAFLWLLMRQVHFDNGDPTIPESILDSFQSYCHHLDRVKSDIAALAECIETAIERQGVLP